MNNVSSSVTSKDGTTIAYDKQGAGPAVILIDGALCARLSDTKMELMELLAPHFTVYSYDRRGRGDSGDTLPYVVEREIEDIEALIADAGGTAYLYGHSSGAVLALEAALKLGPKVQKVALYEAPYNDDPEVQRGWNAYTKQLVELLAAGRRGDAVASFMTLVGMPEEQIAGVRQSPGWSALEAIAPTLAYDHPGLLGETGAIPAERLAALTIPTLVMNGGASYPFMYTTARALSDILPHARYQVLEGQRHDVSSAVLAPALIAFF